MVIIRPMTSDEFPHVMAEPHRDYARGLADAESISLEAAEAKAAAQTREILTDGFDTPGHHFFVVERDAEVVGMVWVQIKDEDGTKKAWGFNIFIDEAFRRQGLARQTLQHLIPALKDMGVTEMAFHVYAHNRKAITLYEEFGFETTNILMRRIL